MTDQELKDLVASLAIQGKETDRRMQETDRRMQETDLFLKELGRELGGLGNKFGSFTEGLTETSIERILRKQFDCDITQPAVKAHNKKSGLKMEIDYLGVANGSINRVVVVEIKSHFRPEYLDQMEKIIENFPVLFSVYKGYTLEAMFVIVSSFSKKELDMVTGRGFHLARAVDDDFVLADPPDFVPRRVLV